MISAGVAVHAPNGLWNTEGGFELPLAYGTVVAAVAFTGPGRFSLDRLLGWNLMGVVFGIDAIALGLAGALIVLAWRSNRMRIAASGRQDERQREKRAA
jgi:putative oxidoreductase